MKLGLATLAALSLLSLACGEAKRPDIIFLTLDTTRADHLGPYGYDHPVSPSLDALAQEGVVFDRAWSTAPWTLPAHASMFTGLYPTTHGAHFDVENGTLQLAGELAKQRGVAFRAHPLAPDAVTLAELASEHGYATGAFVGGPWLAPEFGVLQGFDEILFEAKGRAGTRASALTRAAVSWLGWLDEQQPALLFINYFDPHGPYDPPKRFRELASKGQPTPIDEGPLARQQREILARYDGEIRFMDHHLGGLLTSLRRLNRYDDAIIVVVADHGELFGEHQQLGHRNWLYEELVRVPLIVRYPDGRDAGTRSETMVSVVDLLPMIAQEAGLPLPKDIDGVPIGTRRLVLAESYRDALGIANDPALDRDLTAAIEWPWKLIASSDGTRELFRIDEDPGELHDLAASADSNLSDALAAARAALRPPVRSKAQPTPISPDAESRLRELGYLESE